MATTQHGTFRRIDESIEKWADRVVKISRGNLTREKAISTKTLWRSIHYRMESKVGRKIVVFVMEPYGAFLDKGVSGTGQLQYRGGKSMPVAYNKSEAQPEYSFKVQNGPVIGGSLKKWLQTKGMDESLDYVIRRSIHARGIRPRRFFSDTFKELTPELNVVIGQAATFAVNEALDKIFKT